MKKDEENHLYLIKYLIYLYSLYEICRTEPKTYIHMLKICARKFYSNKYFFSCETKFIFQCKEYANEGVEMLAYVI